VALLATANNSAVNLPNNFNSTALPTAVEDAAAHIHSAAAGHSSTINTAGATISDSGSSTLRGAASEHVNDHPGNDGLSHQPLELPSQAVLHAAVENPLATANNSAISLPNNFNSPALPPAVEDADGGDAAHIHIAAAEHSSTIDTAGATISDSNSLTLRGAASEHVNDHAGNDGLSHQPLELPSLVAAHAAVEIPPATAVENANGGDAAHIHSAAAEHSSTIDTTAGATVAHSDASSFPGTASEHVNDQPHFENANSGTLQSLELPSQAAAHAAVEIPLATAVEDANGGDAAHIHSAAAEQLVDDRHRRRSGRA
jgi:hypothetical protein